MSFIKLFFNILKSHKINFILPLAIVLIFSVIMVKLNTSNVSEYNPYVYIIDKDNTEFSRELVAQLDKYSEQRKYTDNVDLEEELMTSYISVYIEIPKGFTEEFNTHKETKESKFKNKIILKSVENSKSKVFINEKINNFLNAELNGAEVSNDFINLEISSALDTDDSSIKISTIGFSSYAILYGIPSIVGTFVMLIRRKNIKDRYSCAPISNKNYLLQITFSSILIMIVFCLILSIFVMNILLGTSFDKVWLLNFVNMLIIGIFALGLGLIYGTLAKNMEALNGISTGLSLAFAFLGGIFVPIEIFSNTMKTIAKFTPSYWYENVNYILNSGGENLDINSMLSSFGIQLIFIAVVFAFVGLATKKRKNN